MSLFSTGKYKRNEKRNKTEDHFIKLKQTFRITRTLKSSSWGKGDNDQSSYRWLKYDIDPFFISTVETLSSELRFKKCFGAAILLKKSTDVFENTSRWLLLIKKIRKFLVRHLRLSIQNLSNQLLWYTGIKKAAFRG